MASIFSAEQIKDWDRFTIQTQEIQSIELMECAAEKCAGKLKEMMPPLTKVILFCGPGNNGGDGLAIARLLIKEGWETEVVLLSEEEGSPDYNINLQRYKDMGGRIVGPQQINDTSKAVIIDAIFGIGLNKPVTGTYRQVIQTINSQPASLVVSIDIPSGMFADKSSAGNPVVEADATLTFGSKKLAFFMPENSQYTGEVTVLDLGLSKEFVAREKASAETIGADVVASLLRKRNQFTHKGDYGHAVLICGSYGMMGAAVLSAHGCLRSGVGKLTCITCSEGYNILQICVPEAMCRVSGNSYVLPVENFDSFDVIGAGPGLGRHESHRALLERIFAAAKPTVLDADALNALSDHKELFDAIPAKSILTPHPKEFERLFGKTSNDFAERQLANEKAATYDVYIVLKGRNTWIATPDGTSFINETGNAGLATGGTGDVLTGILTGLLAQGYISQEACMLGVFLHGLAADLAVKNLSEQALIASDVHEYLGKAFLYLQERRGL